MPWPPPIAPADVAVAALVGAALVTDLRSQRVPNLLTFGGMALGIAANTWSGDPRTGWIGVALAFALMFPAWRLGGAVRAGDVKLLMAVGAFYGGGEVVRACLLTYLLSLPFGLTVLAVKGRLGNLAQAVRRGLGRAMGSDSPEPELTLVAFVPVIAAAVLLTRITPWLSWVVGR
ncbi:MAG: prepilin peptidase [Alphaproteobacteria bacterium]|nr:prepilin peptidase [Alphaproteobacteria bacterium]